MSQATVALLAMLAALPAVRSESDDQAVKDLIAELKVIKDTECNVTNEHI